MILLGRVDRMLLYYYQQIYKLHTNKLLELEAPWIKDRPI